MLRGQRGRAVRRGRRAQPRRARTAGAREDVTPQEGPPLYTNIDLDLQEYIHSLFGDSLAGGAVAMDPQTGEVLALYSSPALDPNRFVGGVSPPYYDSLQHRSAPAALQQGAPGQYAAGSTFKLATAVIGAARTASIDFDDAHAAAVHAASTTSAIARGTAGRRRATAASTCAARSRSRATCTSISSARRSGCQPPRRRRRRRSASTSGRASTCPRRSKPSFPTSVPEYFNQKYGPRGWTTGATRAEPGDRAGRERADGRQHGALLQRARDRRQRADADDRARTRRSARRRSRLAPDQLARLRKAMMGVVSRAAARRPARRSRA